MSGQRSQPQKAAAWLLRPALVVCTAVFLCLTLFLYFLTDCGFFTGAETLTATANENLVRRESALAVQCLRACIPDDPTQIDTDQIAMYREHFKTKNTNFVFFFWQNAGDQNGEKVPVLNNAVAEDGTVYDPTDAVRYSDVQDLLQSEENKALLQVFKGLSFACYVRSPLTAHDDFYRVQQAVSVLNTVKYPTVLLFLFLALLEGWLWSRLIGNAAKGNVSAALQELNGAPLYLHLAVFLIVMANGLYFLHGQLRKVYDWVTFTDRGDVRAAACLFLLLLVFLSWMTTIFVSALRARVAEPQWFRRSALFRAVSSPSVERRLQLWLTAISLAEPAIFLLLFLRLHRENGRLFVWIDAGVCALVLMITFVQARNASAYITATHRIAIEKSGEVPTGELRGKSLEHVQNINFLSRSAGEQTQLRFVNESFSTRLIRNVSQSLREPLKAVTAEAERLENGTLPEAQASESIRRINALSQELKKTIEDLLRIAGASAEGREAALMPTDARLMIEQTVGEFYDRFRMRNIELVQQLPQDSLQIMADGSYMWTAFESILDEFLQYAVSGTRVFLQVLPADSCAALRFQGTVRSDPDPARHSLALPTAKVFTEKQGGVYHDTLAQDILTVELRFALCTQSE